MGLIGDLTDLGYLDLNTFWKVLTKVVQSGPKWINRI